MKKRYRAVALALLLTMTVGMTAGCGASSSENAKKIIRIGHNQSTNHPTHIALLAFEEFIEEELGDKYDVEVFPSELLGSQNEMVQLTQTGAIDFCVASNSLLETFSDNYTLFNLPYLFASSEAYHVAMDKTTPRLIQFHTFKNAVNPPFLGGFSIFGTVAAEAEQRSCQRDSLFSMILCNDRKAIVTE